MTRILAPVIARVLAVVALGGLVACSSSGPPGPSSSGPPTSSAGSSETTPAAPPTREVRASSCPFVSQAFVLDTMGMRLSHLTILRSGHRTVGCRFYALQNSPLHNSEHLPGPKQPVVEIVTRRFGSATDAHNAFVRLAQHGTNAQQVPLGRTTGVCFQNDFYWRDHGKDWACAANVGRTEVVVRTVDTTGTFSTATLTKAILRSV